MTVRTTVHRLHSDMPHGDVLETLFESVLSRYSFTRVVSALVEVCYLKAKYSPDPEGWRLMGQKLTVLEQQGGPDQPLPGRGF